MAKPYLVFKAHTGFFYAQILLPDGTYTNNKSTGCKNRADAERKVMEWIVTGNIPERINGKVQKKKYLDNINLFNELKTREFTQEEIKNIIQILRDRDYIKSAVITESQESVSAKDFLMDFWDFERSPYVKEKLIKGQSIHQSYCINLKARVRLYWLPRIGEKTIGEITRRDVESFFDGEEVKNLAPKTVNSIIDAITIPLKWCYYHDMTQNNCFDGIIKCSNKSKERKILEMDWANKLFREAEWDNDACRIANELAMHTGMRTGEIQALTAKCIGKDEIYVTQSWSKYDGLKCCKNGEERSIPIPIPHNLCLELKTLAKFNPYGKGDDGFIFYGRTPDKPTDSKQFNKYLRRALVSIGYENADDICFYSWRHFFCSRMLDRITDKRIVMALSGHKTEAMLNHYASHLENDKVVELARKVMKEVFIEKKEDDETIQMLNDKLKEIELVTA